VESIRVFGSLFSCDQERKTCTTFSLELSISRRTDTTYNRTEPYNRTIRTRREETVKEEKGRKRWYDAV
jgi:hypothetical protein